MIYTSKIFIILSTKLIIFNNIFTQISYNNYKNILEFIKYNLIKNIELKILHEI